MLFRICVLLVAGSAPALAQNSITGTVLDPSGASIPDAAVLLKRDGRTVKTPATTDIAGGFRFGGVTPGTYSVEIRHEGFRNTAIAVRVPLRNGTPLRVVLPLALFLSTVEADGNGGG